MSARESPLPFGSRGSLHPLAPLRCGNEKLLLVAESYVPPAEILRRRDLARERKRLIDDRTRYKNRVQAVLKESGNAMDRSPFTEKGRQYLTDLDLDRGHRWRVESALRLIDVLDEEIATFDRELEAIACEDEQAQRLQTIPGVGAISAVPVLAELGEVERFAGDEQAVSYAGLDPTVKQSGEKDRRGPISKEGSSVLRWMLVQCATNVVKHGCEYFREFYHRLRRRKNEQLATVATARKVLVSMYYMLTRQETFDPPGHRAGAASAAPARGSLLGSTSGSAVATGTGTEGAGAERRVGVLRLGR